MKALESGSFIVTDWYIESRRKESLSWLSYMAKDYLSLFQSGSLNFLINIPCLIVTWQLTIFGMELLEEGVISTLYTDSSSWAMTRIYPNIIS
jgi:hypothetical protein